MHAMLAEFYHSCDSYLILFIFITKVVKVEFTWSPQVYQIWQGETKKQKKKKNIRMENSEMQLIWVWRLSLLTDLENKYISICLKIHCLHYQSPLNEGMCSFLEIKVCVKVGLLKPTNHPPLETSGLF